MFDYTAPTVSIVSSPAGTPVSGSTNTFDYPILSSVTLTCMVNPTPSSSITYQWNTVGCYTNSRFTPSNPECFPHGQITQSVTGNDLNAEDAGTITCTVTISGSDYTSEPFTLRISGKQLVYCVITCIVYCKQCMLLLLATCYCCIKQIPICDGKQFCNHGNINHMTSKYQLSRDFLFAFILVWNLILASFVSSRSNEWHDSLVVIVILGLRYDLTHFISHVKYTRSHEFILLLMCTVPLMLWGINPLWRLTE